MGGTGIRLEGRQVDLLTQEEAAPLRLGAQGVGREAGGRGWPGRAATLVAPSIQTENREKP
jgi:hypothetical protein